MKIFSSTHASETLAAGVVATAYPWGVEGLTMSHRRYDWPIVDLSWTCNNDYNASDVYRQVRGQSAYILPASLLYGTWQQQLLLRPDYNDQYMVIELRGNPGYAKVVDLTVGTNGQYNWSLTAYGLTMNGWVKAVGNPTGSKLRMHINQGSFRSQTWSNVTLTDLSKVP